MKTKNNNAATVYLKAVKKYCPYTLRKRIIDELENSITDFLEANPDKNTIKGLTEHFGEPKQIALEFIAVMDDGERADAIKKSKWIKRVIIATAAIIILIVAITAIYIMIDGTQVYYYEEIVKGN